MRVSNHSIPPCMSKKNIEHQKQFNYPLLKLIGKFRSLRPQFHYVIEITGICINNNDVL